MDRLRAVGHVIATSAPRIDANAEHALEEEAVRALENAGIDESSITGTQISEDGTGIEVVVKNVGDLDGLLGALRKKTRLASVYATHDGTVVYFPSKWKRRLYFFQWFVLPALFLLLLLLSLRVWTKYGSLADPVAHMTTDARGVIDVLGERARGTKK